MDIRIENLTKAYGDFKAVDNMNLHIADGELVGLFHLPDAENLQHYSCLQVFQIPPPEAYISETRM